MSTSPVSPPHFTEPTTSYWQEFLPAPAPSASPPSPPYQYFYPAALPDGRILRLPIRQLPGHSGGSLEAVASLIANQAAVAVAEELGALLAAAVADLAPAVVVGLPTLGLGVAAAVAKGLGLGRYVPLGYSLKFWYTQELSTELSSITSPTKSKRVYLDPNQLELVRGKRVVIVDDAVSSGATLKAAWEFLEGSGVRADVVGVGVVMVQGERWKSVLGEEKSAMVRGVFESPLLKAVEGGWDVRE